MTKAKEKIEQLLKNKKKELADLEQKINRPDFWKTEKDAPKIQQRFAHLREEVDKIEKGEFNAQEVYLDGQYDRGAAILSIQSGAGGRDSEDWTTMLLRMYQGYCQRRNWKYRIVSETFGEGGGPEGRLGIKDVSMKIKGKFAYGLLKKETGIHRLVRISPFSAQHLRHTSFAKVEVLPEIDEEVSDIKIRPEDLKIETFRASGPGGQYVNRRESAVRITHLPSGLKAASQTERLQGLNRKIAMQVLLGKLLALKEKERQRKLDKVRGGKIAADFGNQIRNYVLHPYKMVKDLRTKIEVSDTEAVLNGDIDKFIEAEIVN